VEHEHEYLRHAVRMPPDVFQSLMEEYGQDVWNYAYFLSRNADMTDDITQDVFLKAYQAIDSFRGEASAKTWLFAITRNTALNYRKSAFFRKVFPVAIVKQKSIHPSAENEFFDKQYTDNIWKIVMALPDKFREVLLLEAKYKLKLEDIAQLTKTSLGTVKSRLFRARVKVFEALKEEDRDE
jgi:RNA polymerase sigma-70 factor (ECF subfamily)